MPNLFSDYVTGLPLALQFFEGTGGMLDRISVRARATTPKLLPELYDYLVQTNRETWQAGSLAKLASGARTIVTGQQLGFFGGPVLTLYKALTLVSLAKELENRFQIEVVPIFWLQSEDHDFEEIRTASFQAAGESLHDVSLRGRQSGPSVGEILLEADELNESSRYLAQLTEADPKWQELLRSIYVPGASLVSGFVKLMQEVLSGTGILFFDPNSKSVKSLCKELIFRTFDEAPQIEEDLGNQGAALEGAGYQEQVALKPGYPLWFYSTGAERERLRIAGQRYVGKACNFSQDELKQEIENRPERFTSSALIRPVFQEYLFHSIAYVGGPAEVSYWAQTSQLFKRFGLMQPVVVPRARVRVLEPKYKNILEKIGADLPKLEGGLEKFLADRFSGTEFDSSAAFAFIEGELKETYLKLAALFQKVDANLSKPNEQTFSSAQQSYLRLKARYERALSAREALVTKQFGRVREALYPGGLAQERKISMASFLLKYGDAFIDEVMAAIRPLNYEEILTVELGAGDENGK